MYDFYPHSSGGRKTIYTREKSDTLYMMDKGKPTTRKVVACFERIVGFRWPPKGDKILYGIKIVNIEYSYAYDVKSNPSKLLASGSYLFGDYIWDNTGTIRLYPAGRGTVTRYFDEEGSRVPMA